MAFSDNLQYLRKLHKITQEELAEKLQVSRQSVSKWETGEAYPETEKIILLCDIFGVSMDELMRGDVTAPRRPAPERAEGDELYCTPEEAEKIKKFSDLPPKAKKYALSQIVRRIVAAALLTCSLVCYLCIGCLLDLWHPGWLIFLLCFSVVAFTDRLFVKPKGTAPRPVISCIFKGLSDMALPLGLTIYLFAGFCYSLWHPTWIVFIVALAFSALTDQIASLIAHGAQNKTA